MYDVKIPESLYQRATDAARAESLSIDEFIVDAVQRRLSEPDALTLLPDQIVKVREALASVNAGKVLNLEQLEDSLAAKKSAWHEENRH